MGSGNEGDSQTVPKGANNEKQIGDRRSGCRENRIRGTHAFRIGTNPSARPIGTFQILQLRPLNRVLIFWKRKSGGTRYLKPSHDPSKGRPPPDRAWGGTTLMHARPNPNVNPPPFSQLCARISAELVALESERDLARLADPRYRAFLADLFRVCQIDDEREEQHPSAARLDAELDCVPQSDDLSPVTELAATL